MLNRNFYIGLIGSLIISIISYLLYKAFIPPEFELDYLDGINKTGMYIFEGRKHSFIYDQDQDVKGSWGWRLKTKSSDGKLYFDLYKGPVFNKTLQVIDYVKNQVY